MGWQQWIQPLASILLGMILGTGIISAGGSVAAQGDGLQPSGTTAVTLNGTVLLQGRTLGAAAYMVPLTVNMYMPGGNTVVGGGLVVLNANGAFTVPNLPGPGTYDIEVKQAQAISRKATNFVVVDGVNTVEFTTLGMGDADNNNLVDIIDFSLLRATFGSSANCGTANPPAATCADYDANGLVDIVDFSLLRSNFGARGPQPALQTEIFWINPNGGAWDVASNWAPPRVPSSTDNAHIDLDGTYTVILHGAQSTNGLTLAPQTGLQTLRIEGNAFCCQATLTVANGFTNNGTIELTSINGNATAQLTVASGTLVNAGTIASLEGTSGSRIVAAQVTNQGAITAGGPLTFDNTGRTFTATSGTLSTSATHTLTISGGSVSLNPATLQAGGGTLDFANTVTLNLTGALTNPTMGNAISFSGQVAVNGSGPLTNTGTLDLTNDTLNLPFTNQATATLHDTVLSSSFANEGTAIVGGSSSVGGILTTSAASTLRVQGNAFCCVANFTVVSGFTNNGTIELSSINGGAAASLTVTSGTLTNAGTITSLVGTGGSRTLTAQVTNQGAISATGDLNIVNTGATFTGTSGSLSTGTGHTLTISGGTSSFDPVTIQTGSGTLDFAGTATLNLASALTNPTAGNALSFSGTVAVNGPGTFTNTGTVDLTNDTLNVPFTNQGTATLQGTTLTSSFSNQGTAIARGILSLSGPLTTNASSILRVQGDAFCCQANFTVANGFTNNGTIELTSINGAVTAQFTVTSGTLLNVGAISSLAGTGGIRIVAAQITNQGTINALADLTIDNTSRTFTGTGGTLNMAAGRTLAISGGTVNLDPVTVGAGTGTLDFAGNLTLNLASALPNPVAGNAYSLSGQVIVNGPGVLTNSATLDLTDDTINVPFTNSGTATFHNTVLSSSFSSQGTVTIEGNSSVSGTLTTNGASVLRVQGNAFCCVANFTVANGFVNNGTIELTSINGFANATMTISSGTLTNAGTITSATGTGGGRVLAAQITNQGSITAATANLTIDNTSRTFTATSGTVSMGTGRTLTISGGTVSFDPATAQAGSGTLDFGGTSTLGLTGAIANPLAGNSLSLSGQITVNGPGALTNSGTLDLTNDTLNVPFNNQGTATLHISVLTSTFTNSGTAILEGNSSVAGALTTTAASILRVQGNAFCCVANFTVASGFTNNGTIELTSINGATSATLTITSGTLTNAGTINTLAGGGRSIAGNVSNAGQLNPGGTNGTGALTIAGTFAQTAGGTLNLELSGAGCVAFDSLSVNSPGTVTLAGTLNVSLIAGCNPTTGQTFDVFTFVSRTNDFTTFGNAGGEVSRAYISGNTILRLTGT